MLHVMRTSFVAHLLIIISEKTPNIATHVKHCRILLIKTRALVTYAIVHQVIVSVVELALEVRPTHAILLRKVRVVIVRLARSSMQIFVAPFVSSGDWH